MMCSLGAKRQPSTTEPLRLTDTHMVVVCTCGGEAEGESVPKARPGTRRPRPRCGGGRGGGRKHLLGLGSFAKPRGMSGKVGHSPGFSPSGPAVGADMQGSMCVGACVGMRV